ncbi:MAG: hypothetical protein MI717_05300 [Spirochaetales bacterium]|nr:hypothetical protein [Spirochaetales bacterium]
MCPDPVDLSAYYDQELPMQQMEELARHIENCSVCRAALLQFQTLGEKLSQETAPVSEAKMEDFWAHAASSRIHRFRRMPQISIPLPALVAATALFAAVSLLHFFPKPSAAPTIREVIVLETSPRSLPSQTLSLSLSRDELKDFLVSLSTEEAFDGRAVQVLPQDLALSRLGEPQLGRPASFEVLP